MIYHFPYTPTPYVTPLCRLYLPLHTSQWSPHSGSCRLSLALIEYTQTPGVSFYNILYSNTVRINSDTCKFGTGVY